LTARPNATTGRAGRNSRRFDADDSAARASRRGGGVTEGVSAAAVFTPNECCGGRELSESVIEFNLANIGGPSAGLMFSLAVIDKLTTGDLNDGKFVAGTGTISADGVVGSIGGITHKMMAAQEAGA